MVMFRTATLSAWMQIKKEEGLAKHRVDIIVYEITNPLFVSYAISLLKCMISLGLNTNSLLEMYYEITNPLFVS
jgi:hypothetical protein